MAWPASTTANSRNGELRNLCGFDALSGVHAVPSKNGFSHFLCNLMNEEALVANMFHGLEGDAF